MRELSERLARLHSLLLDRERATYERGRGAVAGGQLLHAVLHDEHFAWLRALSALMAQIDELVDTDGLIAFEAAQGGYRAAYRLLKSDAGGVFHEKYLDALQESPDVVMAHADVSEVLRAGLRARD